MADGNSHLSECDDAAIDIRRTDVNAIDARTLQKRSEHVILDCVRVVALHTDHGGARTYVLLRVFLLVPLFFCVNTNL